MLKVRILGPRLWEKFLPEALHSVKATRCKAPNSTVIIQDIQPTKTILCNKFEQTLAKKHFLIKELLFGQI